VGWWRNCEAESTDIDHTYHSQGVASLLGFTEILKELMDFRGISPDPDFRFNFSRGSEKLRALDAALELKSRVE
jgi:hypothetical protein